MQAPHRTFLLVWELCRVDMQPFWAWLAMVLRDFHLGLTLQRQLMPSNARTSFAFLVGTVRVLLAALLALKAARSIVMTVDSCNANGSTKLAAEYVRPMNAVFTSACAYVTGLEMIRINRVIPHNEKQKTTHCQSRTNSVMNTIYKSATCQCEPHTQVSNKVKS